MVREQPSRLNAPSGDISGKFEFSLPLTLLMRGIFCDVEPSSSLPRLLLFVAVEFVAVDALLLSKFIAIFAVCRCHHLRRKIA
jgi:hypothetical protein